MWFRQILPLFSQENQMLRAALAGTLSAQGQKYVGTEHRVDEKKRGIEVDCLCL